MIKCAKKIEYLGHSNGQNFYFSGAPPRTPGVPSYRSDTPPAPLFWLRDCHYLLRYYYVMVLWQEFVLETIIDLDLGVMQMKIRHKAKFCMGSTIKD